ncbi:recombinase family protein [Streptomyces massasporeus]|uniref:recombinase family protein n=1 Tax=Streptomyces massasporeus TaxID=67324 RepID=UPI0036BDFA79
MSDGDLDADLYLRLSVHREGKTAIERQEADCRAWAAGHGLVVRQAHVDRGRSGFKDVTRKGFEAARRAVTSGAVRTLIVWKLDRLARVPPETDSPWPHCRSGREPRRKPRVNASGTRSSTCAVRGGGSEDSPLTDSVSTRNQDS